MDRCALFVDARYVLADGAMAAQGISHAQAVSWDYPGLLQFLAGLATDRTGLPLLRCYWYDVTADGRHTPEHDILADLPGVAVRLGRTRPGRREGVETEIHRDLTTLARNRAVSDVLLVSADDDLAHVIADVQDLGVRVILLHVCVDGNWTVSRSLRQQSDDIVEIQGAQLRPYAELADGALAARYDDQYVASAHGGKPLSNGHAAGPVDQSQFGQAQHGQAQHGQAPSQALHGQALQGEAPSQQPYASSAQAAFHEPSLAAPPAQPPAAAPPPLPEVTAAQGHASPAGGPSPTAPAGQRAAAPRAPYEAAHTPASFAGPAGMQLSAAPTEQFSSAPVTLPSRRDPQEQGLAGQSGPRPAQPQPASPVQPARRPAPAASAGYVPQQAPYGAPPMTETSVLPLADTVQAAHAEGFEFGESVAREAPALWLEAVLARKPRMPTDLEARLLQGSALPVDSLLHDEVRQALRRGFWDALERSRR